MEATDMLKGQFGKSEVQHLGEVLGWICYRMTQSTVGSKWQRRRKTCTLAKPSRWLTVWRRPASVEAVRQLVDGAWEAAVAVALGRRPRTNPSRKRRPGCRPGRQRMGSALGAAVTMLSRSRVSASVCAPSSARSARRESRRALSAETRGCGGGIVATRSLVAVSTGARFQGAKIATKK